MSGQLGVRLVAGHWSTDDSAAAVAEIVPRRRGTDNTRRAVTASLAVNAAAQQFQLEAGDYTVRLFLPSGEALAERLSIEDGAKRLVTFELPESPHEWLAHDYNVGAVQWLPDPRRLEAMRTSAAPASAMAEAVMSDMARQIDSVERISGLGRVPAIAGWRWRTAVDPARAWPTSALPLRELVQWWAGAPQAAPVPLVIDVHDARNARLKPAPGGQGSIEIGQAQRDYAAVRDPTGAAHYAVLPSGWLRASASGAGSAAEATVLMTVVVDEVFGGAGGPGGPGGESAQWRCSVSLDDVEAMSYLGFLASGHSAAADVMLRRAQDLLFGKTVNPVAAAAGAYGLLEHRAETNQRERPAWRQWIRNLHDWYPMLPDAAIARAQLVLRFGEAGADDPVDIEALRRHLLDAVRRGLPYFTRGVRLLAEMLTMLVHDDRGAARSGKAVDETQRALALVKQLDRITVPGEFFTVLRLGAEGLP